jgi:hypothetical protein
VVVYRALELGRIREGEDRLRWKGRGDVRSRGVED